MSSSPNKTTSAHTIHHVATPFAGGAARRAPATPLEVRPRKPVPPGLALPALGRDRPLAIVCGKTWVAGTRTVEPSDHAQRHYRSVHRVHAQPDSIQPCCLRQTVGNQPLKPCAGVSAFLVKPALDEH